MEIITRKEALEKGLKYYFTGKPCKYGHIDKRYTLNAACQECIKMPEKREKYKKSKKEWKKKNKRKVKENTKKYWVKLKNDKQRHKIFLEKRRLKYKNNPLKQRTRSKNYRLNSYIKYKENKLISPSYVMSIYTKNKFLKTGDIPQELIELKKLQLKIWRYTHGSQEHC